MIVIPALYLKYVRAEEIAPASLRDEATTFADSTDEAQAIVPTGGS